MSSMMTCQNITGTFKCWNNQRSVFVVEDRFPVA